MLTEKDIIESVWPPLRTEIEDTTVRMKCFGRSYEMEGPLPRKITSGGRDVLAAPAVLKASFNGKEEPLINEHAYIEKETDDELVYLTQSTIGNVVLNSRVTAERDGLLWIDLMLFPFTGSGAIVGEVDELATAVEEVGRRIENAAKRIAERFHHELSNEGISVCDLHTYSYVITHLCYPRIHIPYIPSANSVGKYLNNDILLPLFPLNEIPLTILGIILLQLL